MIRIFHPYQLWEEYHAGQWRKVTKVEEERCLLKAVEFMQSTELFGKAMMDVIGQWRYSSDHNLSDIGINRRAWIGQAACCLRIECPEYITRLAWWELTEKQQEAANAVADIAIDTWERNKINGDQLCLSFA